MEGQGEGLQVIASSLAVVSVAVGRDLLSVNRRRCKQTPRTYP